MHTERVRRLLLVPMAMLLMVMVPARAQAQAFPSGMWPAVKVAPSVWTTMGFSSTGTAVYASATGVEVGVTGAGAIGAGGVAATVGTVAVSVGAGALIGWGAQEAGIWKWAGCDHWLNTGSASCESDPVVATITAAGAQNSFVTVTDWAAEHFDNGNASVTYTITRHDVATGGGQILEQYKFDTMADWSAIADRTSLHPSGPTDQSQFVTGQHPTVQEWRHCVATVTGDCTATDATEWEHSTATGGDVAKDRRLTSVGTCKDYSGAGGADVQLSESTPWYAPDDEPPSAPLACPAGYTLTNSSVTREVDDGVTTTDETLFEHTAPAMAETDPYADCYDGSCTLMIYKVEDTVRQDCSSEDVNCAGWFEDAQVNPGNWECLWGTHVMPLSDCDLFRDIDTDTYTGPDTSDAGPVVAPGTAANPAHVEDGCDAGGGSWWNPFDNIAGGVACAMQWAFVPSTESMTQLETATGAMAETVPFTYVSDITGWVGGFSDVGSGCLKFSVPINTGRVDYGAQPAFDCNGPVGSQMRTGAVRGVLTAAVWGFFVVPMAWWAWRQYAPGSQGEA